MTAFRTHPVTNYSIVTMRAFDKIWPCHCHIHGSSSTGSGFRCFKLRNCHNIYSFIFTPIGKLRDRRIFRSFLLVFCPLFRLLYYLFTSISGIKINSLCLYWSLLQFFFKIRLPIKFHYRFNENTLLWHACQPSFFKIVFDKMYTKVIKWLYRCVVIYLL